MNPPAQLGSGQPEAKPEGQAEGFVQRNARDLMLLLLFSVLALINFLVQMMAGPLPAAVANFMRLLEFAFALILGTLIQLVISREQFLREQKRAALGAYRRVLDIKRAVGRLKTKVENLRRGTPAERRQDLDVVDAIADGLSDTVDSSIGDWNDIIGQEMTAVDRISSLMSSLESIEVPGEHAAEVVEQGAIREELKAEIGKLRSGLPPVLQSALEFEEEMLPREGRISFRVLRHFRESIRRGGCIRVLVRGMGSMKEGGLDEVSRTGPFSYSLEYGMSHEWMTLSGAGGSGLVENPLDAEGVYNKDYQLTLRGVVPISEESVRHDPGSVEILGSQYDGSGPEPNTFYVRIPMTEDDFLMAVRRLQLPMP
jgi:hypothetical protein